MVHSQLGQLLWQYTYVACFARSSPSLFDEVYALLGSAGAKEDEELMLIREVRKEFLAAVVLSPLLGCSLCTKVAPGLLLGGGMSREPLPTRRAWRPAWWSLRRVTSSGVLPWTSVATTSSAGY